LRRFFTVVVSINVEIALIYAFKFVLVHLKVSLVCFNCREKFRCFLTIRIF
jgi:hypothetical protein